MRKKIVAGNWKLNKNKAESIELTSEIKEKIKGVLSTDSHEVILCPPFVHISNVVDLVKGSEGLKVGSQDCSLFEQGAYTGEVSAEILKSYNVSYAIIGHSERRNYFKEDGNVLSQKVTQAVKSQITPIFCCGELLNERESGSHFDIVQSQLEEGLFHLSETEIKNCVIAYEPVWAIGTGKTATPDEAQEMHKFIRGLVELKYGQEVANEFSVLYGGSCKPGNAKSLFNCLDIDGGLIGGASLNADDFVEIIKALGS